HVRLFHRIGVHSGRRPYSTRPAAALREPGVPSTTTTGLLRGRAVLVLDALRRAAVALELRFNPVHGRAIPICALTPIPELRESFDRGFVLLQVESFDEHLDGIVGGRRVRWLLR